MVKTDYIAQFLAEFAYPAEAQEELPQVYARILQSELLCAQMDAAESALFDAEHPREDYLAALNGVAQSVNTAPQTVSLLCMIAASKELRQRYEQNGISLDIWRETMLDLRTKAMECKELDGVYGLFGTGTPLWMVNYFRLQRFALGRLQYEVGAMKAETCTVGGLTLRKGDPVLCCHIPSNGKPFDAQARRASYKAAYDFYRDAMPAHYNGLVPITCDSWLLFPDHADMLGEKSNITAFMQEFYLLRVDRMKTHTNLWRIFHTTDTDNIAALPEKTGLQRAYKNRLLQGKDVGFGYGVFLFDGENIIK